MPSGLSLARRQKIGKSLPQFALELAALPAHVEAATVEATGKAALLVTTSARDRIRAASGGDSALSGVGRGGARVGARYDVKGRGAPVALVRATGPLQLIERDTAAHVILPRGVGRAQGRSRAARRDAKQSLYDALFGASYGAVKPLRTPYGPRYRVQHPGTTGKHPFEKGVQAVMDRVPKAYQDALRRAMAKAFR